jgi:hypothetical protein
MSARNDVAPDTLGIELTEDGIAVEYSDGRTVFYHGVPQRTEGSVRTGPAKDTHVLVTDETETQGILTYVNDLNTHDEILQDTGVGRVMLDGESTELFPGVTVSDEQMRTKINVDFDHVDGRVFVFEESDLGERSFEIVPESQDNAPSAAADGQSE